MNESVKFRVHTLLINDDGKTLSDNVGDTINSYKYFYHRDLTWEQFNRLNLDIKRCWQELQHDYPELRGLKYPERIKRGGTKRIEFAKHKNQ